MTLAERLLALRRERGLTQAEAAGGASISAGHLCNLETGKALCRLDTLADLAQSYGLSLRELLSEVDGFGPNTLPGQGRPVAVQALASLDLPHGPVSEAWLDLLSRIEYGGQRLRSTEDALATYLVLRRIFGQPERAAV